MHDLYSIWLFFQLAIFVELNLIGRIYTGQRRERQQQYEDDLVSEVSQPNHSGHGLVRLVAVRDAPNPARHQVPLPEPPLMAPPSRGYLLIRSSVWTAP